jgi:hypothetical protein
VEENMPEYFMELKTDKNLGSEQFVRSFLTELRSDFDPKLRPDRFALGEPIRLSFEKEGLDAAIDMWLKNEMPLMLKRVKQPKYTMDIGWRPEKGLDKREFPWHCSVWLNKAAKDSLAVKFFEFLIGHFEPAYGFVTVYEHEKQKHFVKYRSKRYVNATEEKFVGSEVGSTFPGIYWLTFFNNEMVGRLGKEKFETLSVGGKRRYKNGVILQAYEKCFEVNESAEKSIMDHLGRDKFFDKSAYIVENSLEIL